MFQILCVGCGGFVGAILRYLCTLCFTINGDFPLITMAINFIGSFIIGIVFELSVRFEIANELVLLLQTGLCGGFTTFSTFSLENVRLLDDGKFNMAFMYIFLTVSFCLIGTMFGRWLVKVVW